MLLAAGLAWSFLPDVQRFELPFINGTATTEEMQVAQYLNSNFPPDTVLYSNFNYPLFGYYTDFRSRSCLKPAHVCTML